MHKPILALFCVLTLAGCESRSATVTFTPSALKDCGANTVRSTIEVHWDATLATPKDGVNVWISNKKPERTGVFAEDKGTRWLPGGGVTGSNVTGDWMYPGTLITVTDATDDDKVLARVRVPSAPCD